jgi:DNA-binding MarR family transcriptional regulator
MKPLSVLLRSASSATDAIFRQHTSEGLTLRQAFVLQALEASDNEVHEQSLVEQTGIDRSTLSEMLIRMAAARLVTTRRAPFNERSVLVEIGPKGRRAALVASKVLAKVEKHIVSAVGCRGFGREELQDILFAIVNAAPAPNKRQSTRKLKLQEARP